MACDARCSPYSCRTCCGSLLSDGRKIHYVARQIASKVFDSHSAQAKRPTNVVLQYGTDSPPVPQRAKQTSVSLYRDLSKLMSTEYLQSTQSMKTPEPQGFTSTHRHQSTKQLLSWCLAVQNTNLHPVWYTALENSYLGV